VGEGTLTHCCNSMISRYACESQRSTLARHAHITSHFFMHTRPEMKSLPIVRFFI